MDFTVKFYPLREHKEDRHHQHEDEKELDVQSDIPEGMDLKVVGWEGPFGNLYRYEVGVSGLGILGYEVFLTYKDRQGTLRHGHGHVVQVPCGHGDSHRVFALTTNIPEASHRHYVLAKFKALVR